MDKKDKRQTKEYEKHPMTNFSDSINRSMIGDLGAREKGGCFITVIIILIMIVALFVFSRSS